MEEQLKNLSDKPGVYLFKDESGKVLYVGKARSLKNRVRSYFQASRNLTGKVLSMVQQVRHIETIVTTSEVEALILESNLIKHNKPKYNIRLRDDKHYPYLRVTLGEQWPRLTIARAMKKDGSRYFGPYPTAAAVWETMKLARRLFPLRTCEDPAAHARPCLEYHIGRCIAPCLKNFDRHEDYKAAVQNLTAFLEGKHDDVVRRLAAAMHDAADKLEFERAREFRDQLRAVEKTQERQKIISSSLEDEDVIAFARGKDEAAVQVFFVRHGKLVDRVQFILTGTDGMSDAEVMAAFIQQHYADTMFIPKEILVMVEPEDRDVIEEWLSSRRGTGRCYLRRPQKGEKKKLVDMVAENAREGLGERQREREKELAATEGAVDELQAFLGLAQRPARIECFDISHIQGAETVASMVVFQGGMPDKSGYRKFQVKSARNNDFLAMKEVITRRFRRAQDGDEKFAALPDLVLIDGGKGQLSAAREAMREVGVDHLPTYALAKEEEILFQEGRSEPIVPERRSGVLYLLQRIRDEAHRFAVGYHRQRRSKAAVKSKLDEVPGVGPRRKAALLKAFGSVKRIREASVEELAAVKGMTRDAAERVLEHLGGRLH